MPQFRSETAEDSPVLFSALGGSKLYGLAHENSDTDIFVVTTSRVTVSFHDIRAEGDFIFDGMTKFLSDVALGSHRACEAAFSPHKEFTPAGEPWRALIDGLRVTSPEAYARYERGVSSHSFGDFKRRRHAIRMSFCLTDLRQAGRFNPVMTDTQIAEANQLAGEMHGADLARLLLPGLLLNLSDDQIAALQHRYGRDAELALSTSTATGRA